MKRSTFSLNFILLISTLITQHSWAQAGSEAAATALLFKNSVTKISEADKQSIYNQLGIKLTPDKQGFQFDEFPVQTRVHPTDMNKDGKEEIFVVLESSALYGNTGQNFFLFTKNVSGKFQAQKDFGGGIPIFLSTNSQGYPEIVVGGPGFEHPVYRWNGTKFVYHRKIKDEALASAKDLETYSKSFNPPQ